MQIRCCHLCQLYCLSLNCKTVFFVRSFTSPLCYEPFLPVIVWSFGVPFLIFRKSFYPTSYYEESQVVTKDSSSWKLRNDLCISVILHQFLSVADVLFSKLTVGLLTINDKEHVHYTRELAGKGMWWLLEFPHTKETSQCYLIYLFNTVAIFAVLYSSHVWPPCKQLSPVLKTRFARLK